MSKTLVQINFTSAQRSKLALKKWQAKGEEESGGEGGKEREREGGFIAL